MTITPHFINFRSAVLLCAFRSMRLLFIMLFSNNLLAQDEAIVHEMMRCARKNMGSDLGKQLVKTKDPWKALDYLDQYKNDSSGDVRYRAMSYNWILYVNHPKDRRLRERVMNTLAHFCADSDLSVWQNSATMLEMLGRASDFNDESKDIIRRLLAENANGWFIPLAGVSGLHDQKPLLKQIATGGCGRRFASCNAWEARIALARLGDRESLMYCLSRVDTVSDEEKKIMNRLYGIATTRQPEAIERVVKCLYAVQDTTYYELNRMSPPVYADHLLPLLATAIKDFPLPYKVSYVEADLLLARKWIEEHPRYKIIR